jgi:hypothetical protein
MHSAFDIGRILLNLNSAIPDSGFWMSQVPEAQKKLAGGANHRKPMLQSTSALKGRERHQNKLLNTS